MSDLDALLRLPPFSLSKRDKAALHAPALRELTRHHYDRCEPYRRVLDALGCDPSLERPLEDVPFVPARLFKDYALSSVEASRIVRTMTSSGTTGQAASKILLDGATASSQSKVLACVAADFLGPKRLPLLILDSRSAVKAGSLSARGAGILGFSLLGRNATYALDESMRLDEAAVAAFCARHASEPLLLFGFTFMIWEHVHEALARSGRRLPLERAILVHGGGWKKLADRAVDDAAFKRGLEETCGVARVHNYYGLVEQAGSIFMQCERGRFHCSIFSDVVVRGEGFEALGRGRPGLLQLVSLLPRSYPGHSVLTEDMGEILGEDDCPCGRLGKTFAVHGRAPEAEARGCSDTYAPR